MRKMNHQWATYYSPRNGRISIQACGECGVAKGLVLETHECEKTTKSLRDMRLNGWTKTTRLAKKVREMQGPAHVLDLR